MNQFILGKHIATFAYRSRLAQLFTPQISLQRRSWYSTDRNFFRKLYDNIIDEWKKDKQMKENLKKFREETQKMEKSDEVQKMRQYFDKIESEIGPNTTKKLRDAVKSTEEVFKNKMDELAKREAVQKSLKSMGETAANVGNRVSKTAQQLGQTNVYKYAKEGLKAVDEEIMSDRGRVYHPPTTLKTRSETAGNIKERIIEADETTTGMELHKDSRWTAAWGDFKNNNTYMQKFFDLKMQYEESDNVVVRTSRFLTERITSVFGSISGGDNETAQALEEIQKVDPTFSVEQFLQFCRQDIIPNVLEAIVRGEDAILKDWCYEAPYNVLTQPLKQMIQIGAHYESRVLDIGHVELQTARMMEQGPVLIIHFTAQQVQTVCNAHNEVIEGDSEKIVRMTHIWALCRDRTELNPWLAWRLLDVAMMPGTQWSGKTFISNYISQLAGDCDVEYRPTKGCRVLEFEVPVSMKGKQTNTNVELWDVSGDRKYEACWPAVQHNMQGIVFVYNQDKSHEKELEEWYLKFVEQQNIRPNQCCIIDHKRSESEDHDVVQLPRMFDKIRPMKTNFSDDGGDQFREDFSRFIAQLSISLKESSEQEERNIVH